MQKLVVENLNLAFGSRRVLKDVSFDLKTGDSLAVVGRNGSGKTTLLKVLSGLISPGLGQVVFRDGERKMEEAEIRRKLSFVGPELNLYETLTATENLEFFATMRGLELGRELADKILDMVGLSGRGRDYFGAYSSGMKQRLKYAVALLSDPDFLLLDEPSANLDDEGRAIVSQIMERQIKRGILIIATNEREEYAFAERQYRLDG